MELSQNEWFLGRKLQIVKSIQFVSISLESLLKLLKEFKFGNLYWGFQFPTEKSMSEITSNYLKIGKIWTLRGSLKIDILNIF